MPEARWKDDEWLAFDGLQCLLPAVGWRYVSMDRGEHVEDPFHAFGLVRNANGTMDIVGLAYDPDAHQWGIPDYWSRR